MKDQSTQERSHFGVRERDTGLESSKEWMSSEIVGSEPIVVSPLKLRVLESMDLYPFTVLTANFLSKNKKTKKSAMCWIEGETELISLSAHQSVKTFHLAL